MNKKKAWIIGIFLSVIGTSFMLYKFYEEYDTITYQYPGAPSKAFSIITCSVIILFLSLGLLVLPRMMMEEGLD